jgi:excisionase family DNA binding protein
MQVEHLQVILGVVRLDDVPREQAVARTVYDEWVASIERGGIRQRVASIEAVDTLRNARVSIEYGPVHVQVSQAAGFHLPRISFRSFRWLNGPAQNCGKRNRQSALARVVWTFDNYVHGGDSLTVDKSKEFSIYLSFSAKVNGVKMKYYTAKEAAERLGVNYHTLLSRARRGAIRSYRFGWSVMFGKDEIDAATRDLEKTAGQVLRDLN